MFYTKLVSNIQTYKMKKVVLWSSLLLFLFSCLENDDKKICQIGEFILYETELELRKSVFFGDLDPKEAEEKAIEHWLNQQRIKIELNAIRPEIEQINELRIQDELTQLNLFELENIYITTHLDSLISEQEIQEYYNNHRENYKTESYIVQALYLKVPDTVAQILNIEEYYLLKNDKDLEEIKKYANLYASSFYFETERWIYFDDLVREISIPSDVKDNLVKNRGEGIFKENGETHYINVLNFRTKSISSPMEVERAGIRRHILKRRAYKLRNTAKETILENVKEKYPVSYF